MNGVDDAFIYHVVSSDFVAMMLGVDKSEVSDTLLYIAVPEPMTTSLSLLALAGLCARRRRR